MKRFLARVWGDVWPGVTADVRPDVRQAERSSTAPVSSAAPKKKAFDRGGPVWPPRSNAADDRLGWGSGKALPPQPKTGGSGGQRPPAKISGEMDFFRKFLENKFEKNPFHH